MKKQGRTIITMDILGLAISRTALLGMSPIGLGFFGAAYMIKQGRFFTFLIVSLGMASVLPVTELIKYILIMVVGSIMVGLIETRGKPAGLHTIAVILGLTTVLISGSTAFYYHEIKEQILTCVLEGVIVYTFVILFSKGIHWLQECKRNCIPDNEELISIALMSGAVIYSFAGVHIGRFEISIALAFLCVLFIAYKYGAGFGAVIGTVSGLALGLINKDYAMVGLFCILGIMLGMFRELGRIITTLAYVLGIVCVGLYQHQYISQIHQIETMLAVGVIFLILPSGLVRRIELGSSTKEKGGKFAKDSVESITTHKLKEFSKSFFQLSKTFRDIAQKRIVAPQDNVVSMIEDISSQVCIHCEKCDLCWKNYYSTTYDSLKTMFSAIGEKGNIECKELSKDFNKQCPRVNYLINEGVRMWETSQLNLSWQNRLAESREAIAGQLDEVATIIDEFSEDLYHTCVVPEQMENKLKAVLKANRVNVTQLVILERKDKRRQVYMIAKAGKGQCITSKEVAAMISSVLNIPIRATDSTKNVITKSYDTFSFVEDTAFKALTGSSRVTKLGEKISGDNFSILTLENGQMLLSLSDGMGTGMDANEESESVIELLEQFVEAGFKEESAIRLINSILVLKSESQSFSTIDLSMLNLYTGVCEFVKIGAATTFIKRDNWVETISSTTMPAGVFNQVDFDQKCKKLYDGDYIVMMTDGVLDCMDGDDKEKQMQEIIHNLKGNNPREMSNQIIKAALAANQDIPIDDMTVLVAGIWKK